MAGWVVGGGGRGWGSMDGWVGGRWWVEVVEGGDGWMDGLVVMNGQ
jgi:hypothetical protein